MNDIAHLLDRLLDFTMPHLVAVPILVPMFTAALMLLLGEQRRRIKSALTVISGLVGLIAALALLRWVNAPDTGGGPGSIGVYLAGNWRAPFGIVLVADRLSTLMVALTGVVAFAVSIYSTSRWDRAGVHFHPLLQLQLMGLNGAFLTGDLATHADPVPQALVLTAIVIGFATTALFLVVLLALRGLSGGDHVDGQEEQP